MFFVEGVQNIRNAINYNCKIYAFIYSDYKKLSEWAKSILDKAEFNYELSNELMNILSDKNDSSEILAIIKMKDFDVKYSENPIILFFDRTSKKGNLETIIRSSDALFVDEILFTGHSVDIYDPTVITASMGSFFTVPFRYIESKNDFEQYISNLKSKYKNFKIIGSSLQSSNFIQSSDLTTPLMIMVGNEENGLSNYYNKSSDELIKINMNEGIDSLNVANATSIILYEINRQRTKK